MERPARQLIEGLPALVLIGNQKAHFPMTARLIDAARTYNIPIVFAGQSVHEFEDAIAPRPDDYFIRLRRFSIFFGTDLSIVLRELGAHTLILAGGVTSVSVHYSFVDAHQNDLFCRVVEDCMAGSSPEAHEAALRAMEYMQTGARRRCSAAIAALDGIRDTQSRIY